MSKKNHAPGPVPPGNRSGGGTTDPDAPGVGSGGRRGAPFSEEDPKRRLGGYEGTGEHARQQPGPLNDGDKHSK